MFHTVIPMTSSPKPADGQDYAVLRQTGSSPRRAAEQLQLSGESPQRLERAFQARRALGEGDRQLPRFARHDEHVDAVLAEGGFWAFSERRVGHGGLAVCLPLVRRLP
jgi:hypothetical protein